MYILIAFTIFFWLPSILILVRNIFHDTYIWQVKEYRVDRIISHLRFREEQSNRNASINVLQYGLLLTSALFFVAPHNAFLVVPFLTFTSYCVEGLNGLQAMISGKIIRPKKSLRNLLILGFSFLVLVLPIFLPINFIRNLYAQETITETSQVLDSEPVQLQDFLIQTKESEAKISESIPLLVVLLMASSFLIIAADFASPGVVSVFAIITEPLAQIKRRKMIMQAKTRTRKHKGFKVVAITGSYGKTTTKEILYELIKENFKTEKTRKNYNSPVGVAQEILRHLKPDTEVFIAEMGAYKKGEIANSTGILKPDISIVTGVGPQHMSLFGNIQNIVKAKFEIIEGLKKDGLAILNGDNQYCLQMAGNTDKRKVLFYIIDNDNAANESSKTPKGFIYAIGLEETKSAISFTLKYNKESYPIKIKTNSQHNVANLLAAIAGAIELGMDIKSIVARLKFIELPEVHLKWAQGINNTKILNDSYNSNPEGFKVALDLASKQDNGRKILITKGIIELGTQKKAVYIELAKKIGKAMNLVISSDKQLLDAVQIHTKDVNFKYAKNPEDFYNLILDNAHEGDLLLLEGRLSPKLLDQIIVKK